VRRKKLPYS